MIVPHSLKTKQAELFLRHLSRTGVENALLEEHSDGPSVRVSKSEQMTYHGLQSAAYKYGLEPRESNSSRYVFVAANSVTDYAETGPAAENY